jgi:hypothetical protein
LTALLRLVATIGLLGMSASSARAQEAPPEWLGRMSLPRWVDSVVGPLVLQGRYALGLRLNPFVQLGDFDGDHQTDAAVFVRDLANGKEGILVLRRVAPQPITLGAGRSVGRVGDNFTWLDIWRVEAGNDMDRLVVEKSETATGAIVWDGRSFTVTLVGD